MTHSRTSGVQDWCAWRTDPEVMAENGGTEVLYYSDMRAMDALYEEQWEQDRERFAGVRSDAVVTTTTPESDEPEPEPPARGGLRLVAEATPAYDRHPVRTGDPAVLDWMQGELLMSWHGWDCARRALAELGRNRESAAAADRCELLAHADYQIERRIIRVEAAAEAANMMLEAAARLDRGQPEPWTTGGGSKIRAAGARARERQSTAVRALPARGNGRDLAASLGLQRAS